MNCEETYQDFLAAGAFCWAVLIPLVIPGAEVNEKFLSVLFQLFRIIFSAKITMRKILVPLYNPALPPNLSCGKSKNAR
jgi:hypothetical protein